MFKSATGQDMNARLKHWAVYLCQCILMSTTILLLIIAATLKQLLKELVE